MTPTNIPNFSKHTDGLVPAVIQDHISAKVLMLGYMNEEAYSLSQSRGKVVFFSRSKNRIWEKGESSGNTLIIKSISLDCDQDSILIQAEPKGPTCHSGDFSCFHSDTGALPDILRRIQQIISQREKSPAQDSYITKLLSEPLVRVAQKVGEEGVEVALAAMACDDTELLGEAADLFFHTLILLKRRKLELADVLQILQNRNKS
jgi:phosphoribosyl-ATP pyrophosphohydrolase/phosphoribosyl-AMP cyclohydrolase